MTAAQMNRLKHSLLSYVVEDEISNHAYKTTEEQKWLAGDTSALVLKSVLAKFVRRIVDED
jgi:hypothetical protein